MDKKIIYAVLGIALMSAFSLTTSCNDDPGDVGPTLIVDTPREIVFAADGTGEHSTVKVLGNSDWTVSLEPEDSWLSVVDKTGSAFGLSAEPNILAVPREQVKVVISAPGQESYTITAYQRSAGTVFKISPQTDAIAFDAVGGIVSGGTPTFSVETNAPDWVAEAVFDRGEPWLEIAVDDESGAFTITADPNENHFVREATVKVVITGEGPAAVIAVSQQAYDPDIPDVSISLTGIDEGTGFTVTYVTGVRRTAVLSEGLLDFKGVGTTVNTIYSIESDITGEVLIGRPQTGKIMLEFSGGKLVFRTNEAGQRLINTFAEFDMIRDGYSNLNGDYLQQSELDLLGHDLLDDNPNVERQNLEMIGASIYSSFRGSYDGGGFPIENVYISRETDNCGIFVYMYGTLTSVHVASGTVAVKSTGGVLCANNYGTISDCRNDATITGDSFIGGLCGANRSEINDCANGGRVSGNSGVGGICGYNYSQLTGCSNEGFVGLAGSLSSGGIAGYNTGQLSLSTNSGEIIGFAGVGGICGTNASPGRDFSGILHSCHNSGQVRGVTGTSESKDIGGVVGHNNGAWVYASSNSGRVQGDTYVGGAVGYSYGNIAACYNTGQVEGYGYIGGACGYIGSDAEDPSLLIACYNIGPVSGPYELGSVCGPSWGSITGCFWLAYGDEPGLYMEDETGGEAWSFGSGHWPSESIPGWGIGNDHGTGKYWKTLGQWNSSGTPAGASSVFPKLWWE